MGTWTDKKRSRFRAGMRNDGNNQAAPLDNRPPAARRRSARPRLEWDSGDPKNTWRSSAWMRAYRLTRHSAARERELAARIKCGDLDAQTELIEANLPLVFIAIRGLTKCGIPVEDLAQEATLGLVRESRWFDPAAHSARFVTYAKYWIRSYLMKALESNGSVIQLPERANRRGRRYRLALEELSGNAPAPAEDGGAIQFGLDEIASQMGVSPQLLLRSGFGVTDGRTCVSLDELGEDELSEGERQEVTAEDRELIHTAVQNLSPFETWLICERFGLDPLYPAEWIRVRAPDEVSDRHAALDEPGASWSGTDASCALRGQIPPFLRGSRGRVRREPPSSSVHREGDSRQAARDAGPVDPHSAVTRARGVGTRLIITQRSRALPERGDPRSQRGEPARLKPEP